MIQRQTKPVEDGLLLAQNRLSCCVAMTSVDLTEFLALWQAAGIPPSMPNDCVEKLSDGPGEIPLSQTGIDPD
jgi:hypothetical protein